MLSLHVLNAAAVVLAWVCVWRFPAYRIVALTLAVGFGAELVRQALVLWVLPPPPASAEVARPLEGALRWAIYVDRAMFIAWPAALAACAVRVLAERRAWPVAVAYAAVVVALATSYPVARWGSLRLWYLGVDLTASLVGVASLAFWLRRHWGKKRADLAVTVTALIVAGHLASVLAGPYRFGLFGAEWYLIQLAYLLLFSIVILLQGGALWGRKEA